MSIIPPISKGYHVTYHHEGILVGCFENDARLDVTSRFRTEAFSLVEIIEEKYPLTRFNELYKGISEIPYEVLVVQVLKDMLVTCSETAEYLNEPKPTDEVLRVGFAFGRCRSTTVELGLAVILIEKAVRKGYLLERKMCVGGKGRISFVRITR